jgi:hypothetical protein
LQFLTFKILPPRVYNPKYFYYSSLNVCKPETEKLFAESPSVTIKTHSFDLEEPAYTASRNFSILCNDFLSAFFTSFIF